MNVPFQEQLRAGIANCSIRGKGIVAVSGGADSVALLVGLSRLKEECSLSLKIAHLNHLLRGDESDQDAEFVRRLAAELELPSEIQAIDVRAHSGSGGGTEETARKCRLDFLVQVAIDHQAGWIATAHHLDDQAETVLHHLIRGTGLVGLKGIPVRRELAPGVVLVRPMLSIRRQTVREALEFWQQSYCEDSSNSSEEYTRNRIRNRLIPVLRDEYNPRVSEGLGRLASQAAQWEDFLEGSARELLAASLLEESPNGVRLLRSVWLGRHRLPQQEGLRLLWIQLDWPRKKMSAEHWEGVLNMILTGGKGEFPGNVRLEVRDDLVRLYRA